MERKGVISLIIFFASILTLLYAIYYIQQLSLNIGIGAGAGIVASSNANIIVNVTIAQLLNNIPTLQLALSISYILFVLTIIMVIASGLQILNKRSGIEWPIIIGISALAYLLLSILLETSFIFAEPYLIFSLSTIGGAIVVLLSIYNAFGIIRIRHHAIRNIRIDPSKPYTNMIKLSDELFSKLSGDIKILDMHFDSLGLKNLAILLENSNISYLSVYVLANEDRIGGRFIKEYNDFKNELKNRNIIFEMRILNENDAIQQHERLLIDNSNAYKIPPFNIINRKSEHIVRTNYKDALIGFEYLWGRAKKLENLKE